MAERVVAVVGGPVDPALPLLERWLRAAPRTECVVYTGWSEASHQAAHGMPLAGPAEVPPRHFDEIAHRLKEAMRAAHQRSRYGCRDNDGNAVLGARTDVKLPLGHRGAVPAGRTRNAFSNCAPRCTTCRPPRWQRWRPTLRCCPACTPPFPSCGWPTTVRTAQGAAATPGAASTSVRCSPATPQQRRRYARGDLLRLSTLPTCPFTQSFPVPDLLWTGAACVVRRACAHLGDGAATAARRSPRILCHGYGTRRRTRSCARQRQRLIDGRRTPCCGY